MKRFLLAVGLSVCAVHALADGRFIKALPVPDSTATIVVAEGEQEPRSLGSYSIRLYGGANEDFPMDDFKNGIVRPRDGVIEAIRFAEFDGDDTQEIVVVIRSVGTGAYQSADVFRIDDDELDWIKHLDELPKDADPVAELEDKIQAPVGKASVGAGTGPLQLHHRRVRTKP